MQLALAVTAALVTLAVGVFATTALGVWWMRKVDGFGRWELPAWMAGGIAVLCPMFLSSFVLAVSVFLHLSGIDP